MSTESHLAESWRLLVEQVAVFLQGSAPIAPRVSLKLRVNGEKFSPSSER